MPSEVNVYCDESRYCNPNDPYLVIGAIKCRRQDKHDIVAQFNQLKRQHAIGGEIGWKSVSPNKAEFYIAVIDWLMKCDELSFRCIVVNKNNLWSARDEDGFYVAYHQLLSHWFSSGHQYYVYLDKKRNSRQTQVSELRAKTRQAMPANCSLACMEEVESHECALVQITDLLIGAMGYEWNGHTDPKSFPHASQFKKELCRYIALKLNRPSLKFSTWASEPKFNVFVFGE